MPNNVQYYYNKTVQQLFRDPYARYALGANGGSGFSGGAGASGYSGYSGPSGSGYSGYSGSGVSGYSGYSGYSGFSGNSDITVNAITSMGSTLKGQAVGVTLAQVNSAAALASGTMRFIAVYLPSAQTLTGVKWVQSVIGNYTANNFNGVVLYSYSAGTLTQVAASNNTGTAWSASFTTTLANLAFSGTYAAAAGLYVVGLIYSSSAQTTAPSIGTTPSFTNVTVASGDFTNSGALSSFKISVTSIPTPQAMSGLTANVTSHWVGLY